MCLSLTLFAQEKMKKPLLERMIEPKISLNSSYLGNADVDGGGGVDVSKNSIRLNNMLGGISYTHWRFDWRDINKLPFGDKRSDPIKEMHSFRANINVAYPMNETWFFLAQVSVNSTYEKETDDSYGGGLFTFASYKLDDDHTFQFGAFANYHPIKTLALPVMSYSYRARKTDGLQVVFGFPRTYIGYHLNHELLVRFGGLFSQSVIRLSDTSTIEAKGYVEAKDYMSSLGFAYDLSDALRLDMDLLYSLTREFNLFDSDGDKIAEHTVNPSVGMNFKITYVF